MPRTNSFTGSGILLVDKPGGITSHDAVSRTRRAAGTRKVGHAGTLDPMATGLLVLGVNAATRLLTFVVGLDKEYFATIRLGSTTSTDDREGEVVEQASADDVLAVTPEGITAGIARLTGVIEQVPSTVSAIKVDGKRAYALARAGETVELAARTVTVSAFEVLSERTVPLADGGAALELDVRVECSSGTYIRALARDLGVFLGIGGHLTELRRTRIGPFRVTDAASLENLDVTRSLRSPASVASALFPTLQLDTAQAVDLSNGKRVRVRIASTGGADDSSAAAEQTAAEQAAAEQAAAEQAAADEAAPRQTAAAETAAEHSSAGVTASLRESFPPRDSRFSRIQPGEAQELGSYASPAVPGETASARTPMAAIAPDGRLVGLVEVTAGVAKSIVNFPPDPPASGETGPTTGGTEGTG